MILARDRLVGETLKLVHVPGKTKNQLHRAGRVDQNHRRLPAPLDDREVQVPVTVEAPVAVQDGDADFRGMVLRL